MGNKRLRKQKILFVLLVALFFCSLGYEATVFAASGEIRIHLEDLQVENSDHEEVEVQLYKVGDVDEEGNPKIDSSLYTGEYPQTGRELEELAKKLAETITAEPEFKGVTDEEGRVGFTGISPAVYLVLLPADNNYGNVTPFLVPLPYRSVGVDGSVELQYVISAEPKASPHEDKTDKPKVPEDSEDTNKEETGKTKDPFGASAAKTGDMSETGMHLIVMMVSGMAAYLIFEDRRRSR